MKNEKKALSIGQYNEQIRVLKARFEKYSDRHNGLKWADIEARLEANPDKLWSLKEMEITGGEPDVVGYDSTANKYKFYDCSAETPSGRRSLCYDQAALETRKRNKPENSALQMAADMGIEILNEDQYRELQNLGSFDTKTSSWIETPAEIRILGGAIFADRRYKHVFIYHNGAQSYYSARAFRGCLRV